MKRTEAAIQRAVIRWVKDTYPALIITATNNEANRQKQGEIGSLGIPDLLLFHPAGKVLFLELKTLTGKLNPNQIAWNIDFNERFQPSTIYSRDVAYGYNEALRIIDEWVFS